MKKSFKIISALILSSTMAFGLGATIFATSSRTINETEAATDYTSASHISSYYSSVSGTGSSLLSSICTKISNPFTAIGYSSLKNHYETTDSRGDGYLYDIYSSSTNYKISDGGSSASYVGGGWNKEHTIVKQWWGGDQTSQGSDIIIVRLSDIHCNSVRNNYLFGEVGTSTDNTIGDNKFGNCSNYSEIGVTSSTTVFEPRDEIKGEMARTYFYAVARYLNNGAGNGAAKNWTTANGSYIFSSSGNNGFVQKYLNMLLRWHREYPVSQREITRNGNVESCQSNRNPFVDHPSWVDLIWGGTYPSSGLNYENTSNGTATVTNGVISGGTNTDSVTISYESKSMQDGETATISATSSDNSQISWSSNNTGVVTVSSATAASGANVTLTAVGAGTAKITASATINGNTLSQQCTVTVTGQAAPLKLSQTAIQLAVGESAQLVATTNDTSKVTYSFDELGYKILNFGSRSTFESGEQFKITGIKDGTTTITVTAENGATATCVVTVGTGQYTPDEKKGNQNNLNLPLIIGLSAGGGAILIAGLIVLIVLLVKKKPV